MSTVKNTPEPPKDVRPKPFPQRTDYGRPASGGAPIAGKPEGNPPASPPAGVVPGPEAYRPSLAGNAFSNPSIDGARLVHPDSGDRPSGGKPGADLGTVGDSGNQGAGPGTVP